MKREEAEKVIKIILTADGGCEYCVSNLLSLFIADFNEFEQIAEKSFRDKFGIGLKDFLSNSEKIKEGENRG